MITSLTPVLKTLAVVGLSLLAALSPGARSAAPAEKSGFVSEVVTGETAPCVADPQTLCLNGGRFKVQVNWSVPSQGTSGVGTGVALTGDTGYFWFFSSNNIELVLKVVDGRAFNNKFWVFYGALSNVQYSISVTDTATGTQRTYANPSGSLASVADTAAFDGGTSVVGTGNEESRFEVVPSGAQEGACVPGDSTLCLNDGRFKVEVHWRVAEQGTSGSARAVPLTSDTGEFWFFSSNNIELVLKVVDGRPVNGNFWVFYGALSNVEYTIEVTDTVTGLEKTYLNPNGSLASVADISGFVQAPSATPTPPSNPTPTPTPPAGTIRIVNVGQGGSSFRDSVSGNSLTTIKPGDTVKWNWIAGPHSTTSGTCDDHCDPYDPYCTSTCSADGLWDSGELSSSQTYSRTFPTPGEFKYYCSVHGSMMTGTVRVNQ